MRRATNHSHIVNLISAFLLGLFLILGCAVISTDASHDFIVGIDKTVQVFVLTHSSFSFRSEMLFVTQFGGAGVLIVFQLIFLALLLKYKEDAVALICTASLLVGELTALTLKELIARPRPVLDLNIGYSFPSAHAVMSLLFYGFAAYMLVHIVRSMWQKIIIVVCAAMLVFLIGYSRIVLNVHWFSDVLGGWLLGGTLLSALIVTTVRIKEWHAKHWHPDRALVLIATACVCIVFGFLLAYNFIIYAQVIHSILI